MPNNGGCDIEYRFDGSRIFFVTGEAKLEVVFTADSPVVDIVFIHGLTGDAKKTWSNEQPDGFWPVGSTRNCNGSRCTHLGILRASCGDP